MLLSVSLVNLSVVESSVIMRNDVLLVLSLFVVGMIAYWHFQDNDYRLGYKLTVSSFIYDLI